MLRINPSEFLRIGKLMKNSLTQILENIQYLQSNDNKNINIIELKKLITIVNNDIDFVDNIITEFEKATGEDIDKLLLGDYKSEFYKNKFLSYYANVLNNNGNSKAIETLEMCYETDDDLYKYIQRDKFISNYELYLKGFEPEKYGLTKEQVENELITIYDTKGSSEAFSIMRALVNNAPSNYFEYNFNPSDQINKNSYYDYNKKTINEYITNSEIININGYDYEIAQTLPKNCTNIEMLAYNFAKANTINTMRTLPNKYLELCAKGNSNNIILTCDTKAMNNAGNWAGYYKASSLFNKNTNMIVIDAHGSFNNNEYYTQNTVIHEMSHKFDDMMYSKNIIDKLFGKINYTNSDDKWENAFNKYKNVLNSINDNGYENYPNINEFFADASVAYFKNPQAVKNLCPEVYNLMNKMLDGEYGHSYSDKMSDILKVSNA